MIRTLTGVVVRDAMDQTVVVQVERSQTHPLYQKRYVLSRKYKAHDAKNEYSVGDVVEIRAGRPMSKGKRWYVAKKIA